MDLSELSIRRLRDLVIARHMSAREVCRRVLDMIDRRNPSLGILTDVIAETAAAEADAVDRKLAAGEAVGRLAGIPIVAKDNIDTVPAICAAGLPSLSDYRPAADAEIVRRLRGAGAVIVGVAATDSGAFGVVTPAVTNPRFPDRIAGGSSGGSAAAVAAGFCVTALGTDTGGSIRIPAACCGIAGLKPTHGLLPLDGVRPLSVSVDHIGPLARTVADLREMLMVLAQVKADSAIRPGTRKRIGIPRRYFADAASEVCTVVDEAARHCAAMGHTVTEIDFPRPEEIIPAHLVLSLTEAARFHLDLPETDIDAYPATAREGIELGQSYRSLDYVRAVDRRHEVVTRITRAFDTVDFLLLPTLPVPPPKAGAVEVEIGGKPVNILRAMIQYTAAFDQSGHPVVALPWPLREGIPGSVQIVGALGCDWQLLSFVEELEASR